MRARDFAVIDTSDPHDLETNMKPDGQIILLDMKLGSINGVDVLKKIRRKYPHLPVIMVTGYKEEMASAIKKALSISAYTCFYKPLEIDELLRTIETLRNRELGRILGRQTGKKG